MLSLAPYCADPSFSSSPRSSAVNAGNDPVVSRTGSSSVTTLSTIVSSSVRESSRSSRSSTSEASATSVSCTDGASGSTITGCGAWGAGRAGGSRWASRMPLEAPAAAPTIVSDVSDVAESTEAATFSSTLSCGASSGTLECLDSAGFLFTRGMDPVSSATETPPSSRLRRRRGRDSRGEFPSCAARAISSATVSCLSLIFASFLVQSLVNTPQDNSFTQRPWANLQLS